MGKSFWLVSFSRGKWLKNRGGVGLMPLLMPGMVMMLIFYTICIEIDSKSPPICCTTDTMPVGYRRGVPVPVSTVFLTLLIHQPQTSLIMITMSMSTMTVLTVLLHPNLEYCLNRL